MRLERLVSRVASGLLLAGVLSAAWVIYALLTTARFGARQGARESALFAAAGFGFLLFAVVGVGALT